MTILYNFSSHACSCKCVFLLIFYCKLQIKVKLEDWCHSADCLPCIRFFMWHLGWFSGCGKYNSGYYCTKVITF